MATNLAPSGSLKAIGWAPRPDGTLGSLANLLPLAPQRNPLLQLARKGSGGAQTQEGEGGWDCRE